MSTVTTPVPTCARTRRALRVSAALTGLAALVLAGCSTGPEPEPGSEPAPTLHVAAAPTALDQAVGHAVAEYLRDQGATVTVNTVAQPWRSQSGTDIAIVNSLALAATQYEPESGTEPSADAEPESASETETETETDDFSVDAEVEDYLEDSTHEVLAETPGTLRLNLVTSAATSAFFGLESLTDLDPQRRGASSPGVLDGLTDTGEPDRAEVSVDDVCATLEWNVGTAPAPLRGTVVENLEEIGCEIGTDSTDDSDTPADPSAATVEHLLSTPDTAGLLYGPDPRIVDHGFTSLQDSDQLLPEGRFLVLGDADALETATEALDQPVADLVSTVVSRLDGEQLTELTRIHQRSQPSALDLDSATAARYWLFDQQLIDAPDGWF
ncbi:MAG: hypothetical protein ACTHZD_05170 [Micrococcaceae bacterium]